MVRPSIVEEIRAFEVLPPLELLEGKPLVARLVGRHFDRLVDGRFEQPFDPRFGKMLLKTLSHLCLALGASYGYAERHELSLFAIARGGEARRLLSRITGEASAKISLLLGKVATFQGQLYQFDSMEATCEYFLWRSEQARMEALTACCHQALIQSGADPKAVPAILDGLGLEEKLELLRQNAIDFTALPAWQRRGVVIHMTNDGGATGRLAVDLEAPEGTAYEQYLRRRLVENSLISTVVS